MNRLEAQLAFWRVVARELGLGVPLLEGLQQGRKRVAGSDLEKPLGTVIALVEGGQTLSAALRQVAHAFSRAQIAMVHAGEIGGVLDICVRRMVDEMAQGSLTLAPSRSAAAQQASFWWALGCLLSSGVPVLEAIDIACENVSDAALKDAVMKLHSSVRDGKSLSQGLRASEGVFSGRTVDAVDEAEERGEVEVTAMRLGDELSSVTSGQAAVMPEPAARQEDQEAEKIVNMIILQSVKDHATDIYFEPGEQNARLRYRIDGALWEMMPPPRGLYPAMVARIKAMADLDVSETRLPQTGRILLTLSEGQIDIRVATMPVFLGERVVLRILRRDGALMDLAGICDGNAEKLSRIRQLIHRQQGLIICTGPASSGKTTLVYSLLQELNSPERSIMTIEDPVEFSIDGLGQVQVSVKEGLTFPNALRQIMRQEPDVIMVGEVRDLETLRACAVAASVGRLVISTMHSNTAVGAMLRMLDVGLERHFLNGALVGVIAQRLVRRLCPHCRVPADPPMDSLPEEAAELVRSLPSSTFFTAGKCDECHGTGYAGRLAVHEVLTMDAPLRAAIREGQHDRLAQAARNGGMVPLVHDVLVRAAEGATSIDEALRVISAMDV